MMKSSKEKTKHKNGREKIVTGQKQKTLAKKVTENHKEKS